MLIYTLTFIFSITKLINPVELFGIFVFLFILLFISAPTPEEDWKNFPLNPSFGGLIFDAWKGGIALWRAFWPYFLLLNTLLYSGDFLVKNAYSSVSSWDSILLMSLCPSIIWLVAVWRTSANTTSRSWGALARLASLTVFFDFALRIFIRVRYPSEFFYCEELLLNYSSCF